MAYIEIKIFLLRIQVLSFHLPVYFYLRKHVQYFPVKIFIFAQTCYSQCSMHTCST